MERAKTIYRYAGERETLGSMQELTQDSIGHGLDMTKGLSCKYLGNRISSTLPAT